MEALHVDRETLSAIMGDRLGICGLCGSLTDPVDPAATTHPCDACKCGAVHGIDAALAEGLVRVS